MAADKHLKSAACNKALYRSLPSVNEILLDPQVTSLMGQHPRELVVASSRAVLTQIREDIRAGSEDESTLPKRVEGIPTEVSLRLDSNARLSLLPVINATGVVLHTNLGRAPLSQAALQHVVQVAATYSNLEFDLDSGERSRRDVHAESLIVRLLNTQTRNSAPKKHCTSRAVVVNNCAAATFLVLNSLAEGSEVIVSRGELVEIGGGFRIPDILRKSGAILREIGTTNRTKLADYYSAICDRTALILRVHQSNFRMEGFVERPSLRDLVALAGQVNIPIFEDEGTGLITIPKEKGFKAESSLIGSYRESPDLIAASGDKLLGGPQCGILVGRANLIEKIVQNPLMRTFRVCKLTYAALEGTLLEYMSGEPESIPVIRMLTTAREELRNRCERLASACRSTELRVEVVSTYSVIGGGTTPGAKLKSFAVTLQHDYVNPAELMRRLRASDPAVITRMKEDRVVLDLRTVTPESDELLQQLINRVAIRGAAES